MKVIKHGKYYFENLVLECRCGCSFVISNDDKHEVQSLPKDGSYIRVRCPECDAPIMYDVSDNRRIN